MIFPTLQERLESIAETRETPIRNPVSAVMAPTRKPRAVIVVSPFRRGELAGDTMYAKACLEDSRWRGEDPLAVALIRVPLETSRWMGLAEAVVVYCDKGLDEVMTDALLAAEARSLKILYRHLSDSPSASREAHPDHGMGW